MARNSEDREAINQIRVAYYEYLRQGYTKQDAAILAEGGSVAKAKRVAPPRPVMQPQAQPFQVPRREPQQPEPAEVEAEPEEETLPTTPQPPELGKIKGVGSGTIKRLSALGVTTVEQVAKWSADEAKAIDDKLGYRGRITREDWVGQAKALIDG